MSIDERVSKLEMMVRYQWGVLAVVVFVGCLFFGTRADGLVAGAAPVVDALPSEPRDADFVDRLLVKSLIAEHITVGHEGAADRIELFARHRNAELTVFSGDAEVISLTAHREDLRDRTSGKVMYEKHQAAVRVRDDKFPEVGYSELTDNGLLLHTRRAKLQIQPPFYAPNSIPNLPTAGWIWLDFTKLSTN